MEPVGAHGFAPIAADLDAAVLAGLQPGGCVVDEQGFTGGAGEGRASVLGLGVDGVVAGQLHGPAVVVVLAGEEVGVGETIALGRGMAVVLVGREGVQAETAVGRRVDRQGIVVAHEDRLAIADHQQFYREGAVEGPQRFVVLQWHVRVEAGVDAFGGAQRGRDVGGLVVQAAWAEFADGIVVQLLAVTQAEVDARTGLGGLEGGLRVELVPALMRPALSWRTAFSRRAHRAAVEEHFDLRLPGVAVEHVGILVWEWIQPRLLEEGFQGGAAGAAAGHDVRVLCGRLAEGWNRERQRWRWQAGVEFFRAEFFEQQQLLSERLGAEQWAGLAIGRVAGGGLQQGWQHVVDAHGRAITVGTVFKLQRTLVGIGHVEQVE
ncbi:hypothetical protein D3C81_468120 [compost metagenome]